MSSKVFSDILFGEHLQRLSPKLVEYLFKGLLADQHDYRPDPFDANFRCSQTPYCEGKLVFSNTLEWKEDDGLIIKANGGTLIHLLIQYLLERSGLKIINEEDIEIRIDNIVILGHADTLVFEYSEYLICIDLKTVDDLYYLNLMEEPNKKHVEQLTQYLHFLKEKYPDRIVIGYLWYIRRVLGHQQIINLLNPLNWKIFFIEYNSEIFDKIVNKCKRIHQSLLNGKLPDKHPEKYECSNKTAICPYIHLCYRKEEKISIVEELLALKEKKKEFEKEKFE